MKHLLWAALALLLLPLGGCAAPAEEDDQLHILATTYPIYLFAGELTRGVEGVRVERLDTGGGSCLHDYTLSMEDMKKVERADLIAMNGAGLEDFLTDALAVTDADAVDCSAGVELLPAPGHEGHDHAAEYDPHCWMDPARAARMVDNLRDYLVLADPDNAAAYEDNAAGAAALLDDWEQTARDALARVAPARVAGLITFHDGFQYFADAFGLPLLAAIEEEAGSEASAKEIVEISALVKERDIPVIFTEVNGSDATANAVARETGCAVARLTMLMDGPEDGTLSVYFDGLMDNITAIVNGFAGKEAVRRAETETW